MESLVAIFLATYSMSIKGLNKVRISEADTSGFWALAVNSGVDGKVFSASR